VLGLVLALTLVRRRDSRAHIGAAAAPEPVEASA
jgi:hypothetical protein